MFKIGQRYSYNGNKCTVVSLTKDKKAAKIKYDNCLLGHQGILYDYCYDDNGNQIHLSSNQSAGYYFVGTSNITDGQLVPINEKLNEKLIDYEIY